MQLSDLSEAERDLIIAARSLQFGRVEALVERNRIIKINATASIKYDLK